MIIRLLRARGSFEYACEESEVLRAISCTTFCLSSTANFYRLAPPRAVSLQQKKWQLQIKRSHATKLNIFRTWKVSFRSPHGESLTWNVTSSRNSSLQKTILLQTKYVNHEMTQVPNFLALWKLIQF